MKTRYSVQTLQSVPGNRTMIANRTHFDSPLDAIANFLCLNLSVGQTRIILFFNGEDYTVNRII